jgi:hypothetical protein
MPFLLLLAIFTAGVSKVSALSFSEETDWGSAEFSQSVSGDGPLGTDEDAPFSWNVDYNYQKLNLANPGGVPIIDNTNTFSGALNWDQITGWGTSMNADYSGTPAEDLSSRGMGFSLAYKFQYGPPQKEDFVAFLNSRLSLEATDYLETFTGSVARKKGVARPVAGTAELRQIMVNLEESWAPRPTWRFKLGWQGYGYNRNVAQFESALDTPAALARGVGAFSNTVGGLPLWSAMTRVAWKFSENWRFKLDETFAIIAADHSKSSTTKAVFEVSLSEQWQATLGAMYETSDTFTDWLGVVGISWYL